MRQSNLHRFKTLKAQGVAIAGERHPKAIKIAISNEE